MTVRHVISKDIEKGFLVAATVSMLGGAGAGILVLGFQVYMYLKAGIWVSYSVISLLSLFAPAKIGSWADAPQSWLGVHEILGILPLSIMLFVVGFLLGLGFSKLYREQAAWNDTVEASNKSREEAA